jgi:hypothetical protein
MSMSDDESSSLPATAICPGCGTMVTLPPEPLHPGSPPSLCATCDTEVPDYRRESFPPSSLSTPHAPIPDPPHLFQGLDLEDRKLSRGGLFRSLGGLLAERAEDAVENAKDRFSGQ